MKAFAFLTFVAAVTADPQLLAAPGAFAPYAGLPLAAGAVPYAAGLPYAAGFAAPYLAAAPAVLPAQPVAVEAAPVVSTSRIAVVPPHPVQTPSSQFHSQDEFGNVAHGYANINSAKQEQGNTYGGVTGSYSYVDANGIPQTVNYIADGLGFRVQATNLPVAPVVELEAPVFDLEAPVFNPAPLEAPVYTGVAPAPVEDTAEVAAAKAEFFAAFEEAASREKRSVIPADTAILPAAAPLPALPYAGPYLGGYAGYAGLPYAGLPYAGYAGAYAAPAFAAPALAAPAIAAPAIAAPAIAAPAYAAPAAAVVASEPATRDAVLTKVLLNPGHAVAYRVD